MIKLLEQCKEWITEGLCFQYDTVDFNKKYDNSFFKVPGGGDMDMLTNFRYDNPHEKNGYYYYDIPSDSGKNDKANKVSQFTMRLPYVIVSLITNILLIQ